MAGEMESYIFGTKPGGALPTYDQLQNRRKIVAAMMAQRGLPFPKTFGEGLTYLGDAIGQVGQMRQLEQMEQANAGREQQMLRGLGLDGSTAPPAAAPAASTQSSNAPENDDATPAVATTGSTAYRPAPAYLQASLDRLIEDPERRGYLGQLAGKEAQSPDEVSPTGAAGPFQFIRSTGQQYGLFPGGQDKRGDIDASILAANQLTDDNVKTLTARLGRAPTPGEMALAHQQGAVTAANMISGTGNAAARNLAVNNVAPGTDPSAAASKIMNYYAMPARDRVANAVVQQATPRAMPPLNPTLPGSALPSAALPLTAPAPDGSAADLPPEITQGFSARAPTSTIPSAPPVSQPIRTAPPVQVAQATPPSAPTPTPEMQRLNAALSVFGEGHPMRDTIKRRYEELQQNQIRTYNQQMDEYKYQREQAGTAPERAAKLAQEQSAADIATRYGGPIAYSKFVEDMSKGYDATRQLALALPTIRQTQQALKDAYTGSGADTKLDVGKALRQLGVPGNYTPEVATEVLRSRLQAIAGGLIKSTVGSTNISDADRNFVEQAYSGKITMERDSLDRLLRVAKETAVKSINQHNDRLNSVASDPVKDRPIRNNYRVQMPYPEGAVSYLKSHPETAAQFDQVYGSGHANSILKGTAYGE